MARKIGADCGAGEENKMAESEVKEIEVKERKRKPNFSSLEISVITESVIKHIDVIQSKLTNNITNPQKSQVWEEITKEVNAVGRANRSVQEIKDKWKNLHSTAIKEFSNYKKEYKKTGGGPPPKPPSRSSEQIIEIFEDTPAFSGLERFETGGSEGLGEKAYVNISLFYWSCDFLESCSFVRHFWYVFIWEPFVGHFKIST